MSIATPPPVTPLPPTPTTSSPSTFSNLMDALLAALNPWTTQLQALATNVAANALDCYNNATSAISAALSAAASSATAANAATAAAAGAGAPTWVSGATYAQYAAAFSPAGMAVYRRTAAAGVSTIDPALDSPNWAIFQGPMLPYLHVREQQAANTAAQTLAAGVYTTRILNTMIGSSSIQGASLSSNQVTLPAGTYEVLAIAPGNSTSGASCRANLYNVTDSAILLLGTESGSFSEIVGRFTISASKTLSVRSFNTSGSGSGGQGSGDGNPAVYTQLQLWKVA